MALVQAPPVKAEGGNDVAGGGEERGATGPVPTLTQNLMKGARIWEDSSAGREKGVRWGRRGFYDDDGKWISNDEDEDGDSGDSEESGESEWTSDGNGGQRRRQKKEVARGGDRLGGAGGEEVEVVRAVAGRL
eukprot:gene3249-13272_t